MLIQLVRLFQSQPLGFVDEEVYEERAQDTIGAPHKGNFRTKTSRARNIIHKIWRCINDGPIEDPIAGD